MGQQYAQQQQEAAQKQLAAYLKANPSAVSGAAPIQQPSFAAAPSGQMGGGNIQAGAPNQAPQTASTHSFGQQPDQVAQGQGQPAIPPQLRQALAAILGGQKA